ncbi:MAG: hypothetical protein JW723_08135 [Bacteroidales bacterium]|nr:hypothetical protein [Bacteroidales bacterium]
MPQLVKGGKYVFGWTIINPDLKVRIPDEAYHEYHLIQAEKLIIISGSKTSGGFGIFTPCSLVRSKLGRVITGLAGYHKESDSFSSDMLEIRKSGERIVTWTCLDKEKYFRLSDEFIAIMNLRTGSKLLVVRGSGIGPGFIAKGFIYHEALKHQDIQEYH